MENFDRTTKNYQQFFDISKECLGQIYLVEKFFSLFDRSAAKKIGLLLYHLAGEADFHDKKWVNIICIGTDRATGDCLGPLAGEMLKKRLAGSQGFVNLAGTLDAPVHANNLTERLLALNENPSDCFSIAVDASLGRMEHVGLIKVMRGSLAPGASLGKILPMVGDISITGIVNASTYPGGESETLQSTRLAVVMRMARVISDGILFGVGMIGHEKELENKFERSTPS